MSLFASTMSMFESVVWKNGHSRYMACRIDMPLRDEPRPKPSPPPRNRTTQEHQRHCAQLKTHGIARRSSISMELVREAGRLPIFRLAISPITVDAQKYCSKPGVS